MIKERKYNQHYSTNGATAVARRLGKVGMLKAAERTVTCKSPVKTLARPLARTTHSKAVRLGRHLARIKQIIETKPFGAGSELDDISPHEAKKLRKKLKGLGFLTRKEQQAASPELQYLASNRKMEKAVRQQIERTEDWKRALEQAAAGLIADQILKQDRAYQQRRQRYTLRAQRVPALWSGKKATQPKMDRLGRTRGLFPQDGYIPAKGAK